MYDSLSYSRSKLKCFEQLIEIIYGFFFKVKAIFLK